MSDDQGPRIDSAFTPDPPRKIGFKSIILLFVYHILLAVFLAYAIYNVWPPQPWPGDSAEVKAEKAKADAEEKKAASQTNSGAQDQNASGAATAGANVNSTAANSNLAGNTNGSRPANQNTGATAAGSAASARENAARSAPSESAANSAEAGASVYGKERPPPFWLFGKKFQPTLEVRLLLLV